MLDRRLIGLLLTLLLSTALSEAASRPPVKARHGLAVSTEPQASDVGREILQAGGNAVDAAVAVGFALAVTHPAAGNLGGGGFMVIHLAAENREVSIDYREMAPAAAHRDMYLDERGEVVEGLSTVGYLASGVPGSVAGLYLAWEKFGRLPWARLLEPAIRLAREGFPVSAVLAQSLREAEEKLGRFPESRRIFLKEGAFWEEGEIFRQPELAATLERIAQGGAEAFYRGEVARLLVRHMEERGGNITLEDLARYEAKVREPVRGTYRGHEIVSMGPPSSGGVILIEMLNMMENFPLSRLGRGSSAALHLMAEIMRRAFADRAAYLGDPDFSLLPVEELISKTYARRRAQEVRSDYATPSASLAGGLPSWEASQTTHYSVVDRWGNAVAATTTLNGSYGSGVTIPGAGFLMNNEMDDFTSKPGVANMFGLLQSEANAIAPGKRPLSAMTPTIVKKNGRPYLVLGSPGGPTIINTVFQIILNVVDHGLDIQEAVDAPRIHHQWLPDLLYAEPEILIADVVRGLRARGHEISRRERIGDAHCILIDPESGVRWGAPDPRRGESKASGY